MTTTTTSTSAAPADAHTGRRPAAVLVSMLWLAAAVTAAWFLWPTSLGGCTTVTVVSGSSMEPSYHGGDLVVSRCGPVSVGDVVVYEPPGVDGARVIHRVVGGDGATGWVAQGDNNDFLDPWQPTDADVLGSPVLHLPGVGRLAGILLSPLTWVSVLVLALALAIWPARPDPAEPQHGVTEADPDDERTATGRGVT